MTPTTAQRNPPITASLKVRVLGFDFGLQRIGAATGNTVSGTSQALSGLTAKNGTPNWTAIDRLVAQWLPHKLVVGLPLNMDGSESSMATRARQFGELVRRRFALEVVFIDERLSTVSADALLTQATAPGKSLQHKRRTLRDSLAAELLVQTYLESQRSV